MTHEPRHYAFVDKTSDYRLLANELDSLLAGESDRVANAANTCALLYGALPEVNWAGFYFLRPAPSAEELQPAQPHGELVVGPFQGKPACVRIALGQGVCGTAALRRETIVVADVHEFVGHIACDAASRAEIVIPLIQGRTLIGVLDLDSPQSGRFDAADRAGLEAIAAIFLRHIAP